MFSIQGSWPVSSFIVVICRGKSKDENKLKDASMFYILLSPDSSTNLGRKNHNAVWCGVCLSILSLLTTIFKP